MLGYFNQSNNLILLQNKVKKTISHLALNCARTTTLECMDLCQEYGIDKWQTLQLSNMTMHHFMLE